MATSSHSDATGNQSSDDRAISQRRRSWPLTILKFALATAILVYLCSGPLDVHKIANVPLSFNVAILAAILFGSMLLPAVRWWWLLRIQKIDVSFWHTTKLAWVGYLTGMILPGAAGGDVAKSYLVLRGRSDGRTRSLSTIFVDRFIGIYSLILLGCLSAVYFLLAGQSTPPVRMMCYAMFALFFGATLAPAGVLVRPIRHFVARRAPSSWITAWGESYRLYSRSKMALVGCLLLSLTSSALTAASLTAADRLLGGTSGWSDSLLIGPLVVLANCVPLTPGGVGFAEATASQLFGYAGAGNGAEMMLMIRLVMAVLSLPALLVLFARQQNRISSSPQSVAAPTRSAPALQIERPTSRAA